MDSKIVTVRCKPWSAEGVGEHEVMVDDDGRVRVWDPIGRIYTVCHVLSERTQRRIAKQVHAEVV